MHTSTQTSMHMYPLNVYTHTHTHTRERETVVATMRTETADACSLLKRHSSSHILPSARLLIQEGQQSSQPFCDSVCPLWRGNLPTSPDWQDRSRRNGGEQQRGVLQCSSQSGGTPQRTSHTFQSEYGCRVMHHQFTVMSWDVRVQHIMSRYEWVV